MIFFSWKNKKIWLVNLLFIFSSIKNNELSLNVHEKIEDMNNSSYVDSFFCYLSSQLLNKYNVVNCIDLYGSFLALKKNYKIKGGKWSLKYKRSINCKHPKGFSQKQHCKYGRKSRKNRK